MADEDVGPVASPLSEATEPNIERLQAEHGGWFVPVLRKVNAVLYLAAGLTMLALLAWTVVDIVARSGLSSPLRGTVELTELAVVLLVYLGLARTESQDAHIAVDLLYVRLSYRARLALRIFAGLVGFVVIAVMTWRLSAFASQLDAGNYETGILRLPLAPVALVGVVGSAAFALTVLANLVVAIRELVRGR